MDEERDVIDGPLPAGKREPARKRPAAPTARFVDWMAWAGIEGTWRGSDGNPESPPSDWLAAARAAVADRAGPAPSFEVPGKAIAHFLDSIAGGGPAVIGMGRMVGFVAFSDVVARVVATCGGRLGKAQPRDYAPRNGRASIEPWKAFEPGDLDRTIGELVALGGDRYLPGGAAPRGKPRCDEGWAAFEAVVVDVLACSPALPAGASITVRARQRAGSDLRPATAHVTGRKGAAPPDKLWFPCEDVDRRVLAHAVRTFDPTGSAWSPMVGRCGELASSYSREPLHATIERPVATRSCAVLAAVSSRPPRAEAERLAVWLDGSGAPGLAAEVRARPLEPPPTRKGRAAPVAA